MFQFICHLIKRIWRNTFRMCQHINWDNLEICPSIFCLFLKSLIFSSFLEAIQSKSQISPMKTGFSPSGFRRRSEVGSRVRSHYLWSWLFSVCVPWARYAIPSLLISSPFTCPFKFSINVVASKPRLMLYPLGFR